MTLWSQGGMLDRVCNHPCAVDRTKVLPGKLSVTIGGMEAAASSIPKNLSIIKNPIGVRSDDLYHCSSILPSA